MTNVWRQPAPYKAKPSLAARPFLALSPPLIALSATPGHSPCSHIQLLFRLECSH